MRTQVGRGRGVEQGEVLRLGSLQHECGDNRVDCIVVAHPVAIGAKQRVVEKVRPAHRPEQALGHRLHRRGQCDERAVAACVDVAWCGIRSTAAVAQRRHAIELAIGRLRPEDGMNRIEQRQVDDLPGAAVHLHLAQRDHRRGRAVDAAHHVRERQRRQHRRPVRKTIHRREAAHRLDQRAETRLVRERPGLSPAGYPDDDQVGIGSEQNVGAEIHGLQFARNEVLDQDPGVPHHLEQQFPTARLPVVQGDGLLVARIDFPVAGDTIDPPRPQVVAAARRLDLDHIGAKVGQHMRNDVARHQARKVKYPHTVERSVRFGVVPIAAHRFMIWRLHRLMALFQ